MSKKRRKRLYVLLAVVITLVVVPLVICCGPPLITGQACTDWLSGHVPPKAQTQFLDRVFQAIVDGDDTWLRTVSQPGALDWLDKLRPYVSTEYEFLLRDDLAGLYEYRVQFEDGATAYVTLHGEWPQCPDFRVTDEEVFTHIQLTSIRLEKPAS